MVGYGDESSDSPSPDTGPNHQAPQLGSKPPGVNTTKTTTASFCSSLGLLCLSCLPCTLALYVDYSDNEGSPPGHERPTPILDVFKAATGWGARSIASIAGYDFVPHADNALMKRHIESGPMDTKRIVFACMIPVLVCLSGVFAGLTLACVQ